MNQPEKPGAAEQGTTGRDPKDVEEPETSSPLDPEVEAPINAAVHFDDQQGTEGG